MVTHSSILVWRIPWAEEHGGATVNGVSKSQTRLSDFTSTFFSSYWGAGGKVLMEDPESALATLVCPPRADITLLRGSRGWTLHGVSF